MSLPKPYYDDGHGIVIYNADCRTVLPYLEPVDLVLTDPPYGIAHSSNRVCDSTTADWMNVEIAGDGDTTLRDEVLDGATEWACFGSIKTALPLNTKGVLVWDKGPASGMGDLSWPFKLSWELIFLAGNRWRGTRDEGVIKGHWIVTRKSMGRSHPNEKPVSLLRYLRAAKDIGVQAIGIEIEERYCEIAAKRMAQGVLPFASSE